RTVVRRCPDVAEAVAPLIDDLRHRRVALCHGDFTPKNMLLHAGGFMLVDYETATFGEPAFDIVLFLAHLVFKGIYRTMPMTNAVAAFWRGYRAELKTLDLDEQFERGHRHLGACLLSRTDGTSPADYLTASEHRDTARQIGRELLRGGKLDV